mgnify:CR=1 FL=1
MSRLPREIAGQRLLLRLPVVDDVQALNEAIVASHPELSQWMDWAVSPQTPEQTAEFVRGSESSWQEETALNLLMVEQDSNEIIGATGYPRLDWQVPKFEIGYWVRSDRVGRGYASESTWMLARHAFDVLDAHRVELRMDDRNRRSWSVAERLGFTLEATLRKDVRVPDGSLRDTRVYSAIGIEELEAPARP